MSGNKAKCLRCLADETVMLLKTKGVEATREECLRSLREQV